jgi:hypothetical protein
VLSFSADPAQWPIQRNEAKTQKFQTIKENKTRRRRNDLKFSEKETPDGGVPHAQITPMKTQSHS